MAAFVVLPRIFGSVDHRHISYDVEKEEMIYRRLIDETKEIERDGERKELRDSEIERLIDRLIGRDRERERKRERGGELG